ncbi:MAG: DUF2293 domain-containing protein [Spartobacteria bacterium]|nr:DUF2293 domain-containing protein [Spartobacteria bacterium]
MKAKKNDLTIFISSKEATCDECGQQLGQNAWIMLKENKNAVCLSCADLDHLVFLPRGDTALTRRSRKYSKLSAVVLKWARRRRRYEREGVLVENEALELAEKECDADAATREIRRAGAAIRRAELDLEYIDRFAERVRELYPSCPKGCDKTIAEHACRKYSGRVGRSAAAKELEERAVILAVRAHIRHTETTYDGLLSNGVDRAEARQIIGSTASEVEHKWGGHT